MTTGTSHREGELREVARRLVWWQDPETSLAQPERLIAQVMTLGTWKDVELVREACGEDAMRAVLASPPPGVFDARSWSYWHVRFGFEHALPLPRRFG